MRLHWWCQERIWWSSCGFVRSTRAVWRMRGLLPVSVSPSYTAECAAIPVAFSWDWKARSWSFVRAFVG
ncbi:MAG: hypothetical protein A4E36_00056 [Methanoregulaceae archaeon PtaB.Bin009]|nr:MAG: hypothetical protein A4E36_00056 [Methanoregulaceae archaeon PtaB.Bin009]